MLLFEPQLKFHVSLMVKFVVLYAGCQLFFLYSLLVWMMVNAALENGDKWEVVSDQLLIRRGQNFSLDKLFNGMLCVTVALKCPGNVSFFRFPTQRTVFCTGCTTFDQVAFHW